MADKRKPGRRSPDGDSPRAFVPPVPKAARPNDLEDLTLAPGDPFVKAAYDRVNKTTRQLNGSLGDAVADASGSDALMIRKLSKRSRVMTFQVMGIVWKAGFAKELAQAPPGAPLGLRELPEVEVKEAGVILRPVDVGLEAVLRELIPPALLTEAERMYGLTRVLSALALYFVPRDDGALAGIVATYTDGPTSRRHVLYLQTHVRKADPAVLEQMRATFEAAVPRTEAAKLGPDQQDFWSELERSLYAVKATYKTSALAESSTRVAASVTTGLRRTGDGVEQAMAAVGKAGDGLEWVLRLPVRGMVWLMQGASHLLVGAIQLFDRMLRR